MKMKKLEVQTPVNVYDSSIITSRLFENNVRSIINDKLSEYGYKDPFAIEIIAVGKGKCSGRGKYYDFVKLAINNFDYTVMLINHDSLEYDEYSNENVRPLIVSNRTKKLCLRTLENGVERLVDELIDNEVVFKMETERSKS